MAAMHLHASLSVPLFPPTLFAVLDVISDEAKKHGPFAIRREIVGTIRERGRIWKRYLDVWEGIAGKSAEISSTRSDAEVFADKEAFISVNHLSINGDTSCLHPALSIARNKLRLIIAVIHYGTVTEYWKRVAEQTTRWRESA